MPLRRAAEVRCLISAPIAMKATAPALGAAASAGVAAALGTAAAAAVAAARLRRLPALPAAAAGAAVAAATSAATQPLPALRALCAETRNLSNPGVRWSVLRGDAKQSSQLVVELVCGQPGEKRRRLRRRRTRLAPATRICTSEPRWLRRCGVTLGASYAPRSTGLKLPGALAEYSQADSASRSGDRLDSRASSWQDIAASGSRRAEAALRIVSGVENVRVVKR